MRPLALLLEDNRDLNEQKAEQLYHMGLSVLRAHSVEEARQQIYSSPSLDLAICDINLDTTDVDDKSGYEFAIEIKTRFKNVMIIGYSGHFDSRRFRTTAKTRDVFANIFLKHKSHDMFDEIQRLFGQQE
jgi:CheY-like chemotaxis protein